MAATQPSYLTTPVIGGTVLSSSVDTSFTAPTHGVTVVATTASPRSVFQIRLMQTATTSSTSYVNIFTYDGTTYTYVDTIAVPIFAVTAGSAQPPAIDKYYRNLDLPAGTSLVATTATVASLGTVTAFGAT